MKKRLTAWALTLCLLSTAVPTAFATSGAEDVTQQTGGADISALMGESPVEGIRYVLNADISDSTRVLEIEPVSEELAADSSEMQDCEPIMVTHSSDEAQTAEKAAGTTTSFSTYGAQLGSVDLVTEDGTVYTGAGNVLTEMYNNGRNEINKGANGAYFRDDVTAIDNLSVSFRLSNASDSERMQVIRAMFWLVYECMDYDCSAMFYSNGYSGARYSVNGDVITLTVRPLYTKGFETLSERKTLLNDLNQTVKDVVAQASQYTRAYDKMKFFHDWLCQNNSYNDAAIESNDYSTTVSGAPWSSVSALLSYTGEVEGPVCEGYSRAFQLLCHQVGITAALVGSNSGNHMWNNVRYGQQWTGVDVTWDDGSDSQISYEYFFNQVNNTSGHVLDDPTFDEFNYPVLSVISSSAELPFYDSKSGDWHRGAVQFVYDHGYMAGTTCVTFGVNKNITRSQFAVILYNMAGRPSVSYSNRFSDVPAGQWYTEACLWLANTGIASGYPNGKFGVSDNITREQIAQLLYNRGGDPSIQGDLSEFKDAYKIHDWALTAMKWAVGSGIMSGKGKGILDPLAKATRAEGAALVQKIA